MLTSSPASRSASSPDSPISPLYLHCFSHVSPLHLPYIPTVVLPGLQERHREWRGAARPLYLPHISPMSPPYLP